MNTILTEKERRAVIRAVPFPPDRNWGDDVAVAIEAAVLAKLREQEPVAWFNPEDGLDAGTSFRWIKIGPFTQPLYADPLPAVVQVPHLVAKELERIAQDPPINGNQIAQARVLMAARSIRDFGLSGGAAAPEAHPPVPAPWREAVKVMREQLMTALAYMHEVCPYYPGDHRARDNAIKVIEAAIAQLDSLEGGE